MREPVVTSGGTDADLRPEEQLRAMFVSMGEGLVVQDPGGRITMANPAAAEVLGLTLDQLLGRTSADPRWRGVRPDGSPFRGDDHPAMVTLRTGLPQRGVVMGVDNPARGERRWIQINSEPMGPPGDDGLPAATVVTFTDITAVRESEERLGATVAATRDGMVVVDLDSRVRSANPAAAAILGVDEGDLVGVGLGALSLDVFDERGERIPRARRPLVTTLTTGRPRHGVVLGIDRPSDGRRIWVIQSSVPLGVHDDLGRPEAVLLTLTDITELREAEDALRASEQRYRSLYGYQADAVVRMTPSGALLSASPSVWRVLRYDPNDLPEFEPGVVHPDDFPDARAAFLRMVRGEVGVRFETRLRRGDGRWIWAEIAGGPVYDDDGVLVEVQQSIRDVSGREHREHDNAAMRRVASLVAGGAASREVLAVVAQEACAALPADGVTVIRFDGARGVPVARHPQVPGPPAALDLSRHGTAAAEVLTHGAAAALREGAPHAGPGRAAGMTVAVPVLAGTAVWGCVCAGLARGEFAEGAVDRLRVYADLAAVAVVAGG
ncbi:MAG: PAS domain S-box protein [Thermoleophilia bacterium]|nr:PAS domain S-box protein [Thermoleophilia bacterium]